MYGGSIALELKYMQVYDGKRKAKDLRFNETA